MKRTGMIDIKDILRHRHGHGLARAEIAAATGVSTGTVSHVLERASAAGLSWPLPPDLDDEALRARLYPASERDSGHAEPDWDAVIEDLKAPRKRRRARLSRRQLWVEYRDEALARGGTAYSYSRFCARLKARLKDSTGQAQMRFDYAPGLYGLSDFPGKTLALRTGRGEKDVENAAIRRELDRLNHAPMACGESRRAVFEANERASLQPLPANPWEWGEWIDRKVGPNCHVCIERNYYSVPDGNSGRKVDARLGERMVEVFLERGGERLAVHLRKGGRNQYTTRPEHMPDRLKAVRDIRKPDYGDILLERARRIGPNALTWAERCFASRDFPEQAFATVQGMIRLAEDHGGPRLDALCAEALDLNRLASGFLRERIKNGGDAAPSRPEADETIPGHANIRGGAYYSNDEGATP